MARAHTSPAGNNDSECNLLDGTSCSVPEISEDEDTDTIIKLKEQVDSLTTKLNSANDKIDTLIIENSDLKLKIEDLLRNDKIHKNISHSPMKLTTSITKKKETQKLQEHKQVQTDTISTIQYESRQQEQLSNCQYYRKTLRDVEMLGKVSIKNNQAVSQDYQVLKNKLYIISANKINNNIVSLAEHYFDKKYNICHFLIPNVGANQLLIDIDKKLKGFTMNDFCNIIIGEEDFRASNNYIDLITNIRSVLQTNNHTNIIITLPTFKNANYANLYNSRVNMFNQLLYLDNLTHEYAYILDSNLNLKYDRSMFRRSGTLSNKGMSVVFQDLHKLIIDLVEILASVTTTQEGQLDINEVPEPSQGFFRA